MRTLRRAFAIAVTYTLLALALASLLTVAWTWTAIAYIVGAACAAFVVVFAVTWLRTGWELDNAIAELSQGVDMDRLSLDLRGAPARLVDYQCAINGHSWPNHPLLALGVRVWTCGTCGERVESAPGWVDGRSAS